MNKKNIFIIGHADLINTVGGAMSVFNNLCNFLADQNYKVKALCYNPQNTTDRPAAFNKNVEYVNLYCFNKISYSVAINAYLEKYPADLLIFFFPIFYVDAELKTKFNKIPRILMLHSRPDWYFQNKSILERLKAAWTPNSIAQILSPSFYHLVPEFMKKVVCIPNYVAKSATTVTNNKCRKKIAYLSKVDQYKGHQFLIKSMKIVAKKHPDWSLDIYGQSVPANYASDLQRVVEALGLKKQIHFKGITDNPQKTLLEYDIGVFPSFFEGFSMGLSEMLSVGLPSIGLQGSSGVNELIIDGYNGYLTKDDPKEYAKKIIKLIEDAELRQKMSMNAVASVAEYSEEKFNGLWLNLINDILTKQYKNTEIEATASKYPLFSIDKIINSHKWLGFFHQNSIKLFNFIPLYTKDMLGGQSVYKFLGIPVFKIRRVFEKTKYYIFNICILEVTKNEK